MGGVCSRKRDRQVGEETHRGVSFSYYKSGSSKWLGIISSHAAMDIHYVKGKKCPSLMDLCICKISENLNKYSTFSMLPRDINQQLFNELVFSQRLNFIYFELFRNCALQDICLGGYSEVNPSWMDVMSSQGKSLLYVDLTSCDVTDSCLVQFTDCTNLQALNLNYCDQISNNGLQHLRGLSNLTSLSFRRNAISAQGMSAFSNLNNLLKLDLERCPDIHGGLVHLQGLSKLESLNVNWCNCITDDDIKSLSGLANLKSLQLSCCVVTNDGIAHLKDLHKLSLLNLEGCPVTGACLETLSEFKKLQSLEICGGGLTDSGVKNISQLSSLTLLNLSQNGNMTDKSLEYISGLIELGSLNLSGSRVTREGLRHLKLMKKLRSLTLEACNVAAADIQKLKSSHLPSLLNFRPR